MEFTMRFVVSHRLMVAIIVLGLALLVITAVGLYGLLRGPSEIGAEQARNVTASPAPRTDDQTTPDLPVPVLQATEAEPFVRSVASALFDWDTRLDGGPSEIAQPLVDVATTEEAPAAASDVRNYLPSNEMWDRLSTYGTQQWLDISSVTVPDTWSDALAQATPGQIPRGAVAYTLTGTRHRSGNWGAERVQSERAVAFTVFAVCPTLENCTLLRLSQLDRPLK
jgi:hypothetical protein